MEEKTKKMIITLTFPDLRIVNRGDILRGVDQLSMVTSGRIGLLPRIVFERCVHSKQLILSFTE